MLDETQLVVTPGVSTPESVAMALFQTIVRAEAKKFHPGFAESADRKWILDTYAECLRTVQSPGGRFRT